MPVNSIYRLIIPTAAFSAALAHQVGASEDYGPAVWYPASCVKYGTTTYPKQLYVCHMMEGYYHTLVSWQNDCTKEVSSHYAYNSAHQTSGDPYPEREIGQFVRDQYYAWTQRCWNKYAMSTEHEGFCSNPAWFTDTLYQDSADLVRSKCEKYGIAKDRNHVIGHNEGNGQNPAWEAWSEANIVPIGTFDAHCNTHSDPGVYWDWGKFMAHVSGNPPYLFDNNFQGWACGNGLGSLYWTADWGWPGVIYADQIGNDGFFYSPVMSVSGISDESINVSFYPQYGSGSSHDMQLFWKTDADNTWTAGKSSPIVAYTGRNVYVDLNMDVNSAAWSGQIINQWRLDVDNTSVGAQWVINHLLKQSTPRYYFTGGADGWTSGNGVLTPWWTDCCGWPGILVVDQTGSDGYIHSPPISGYRGALNDRIEVRVFPQSGTSTNHEMKIYWKTLQDDTWTESKSTINLCYAAMNEWKTLVFDVGANPAWGGYSGQDVCALRLDVDAASAGTRFIFDYIKVIHDTDAAPKQINNASIAGVSVPASVVAGQRFNATITMRNDGSRAWFDFSHKLRAQSPADNTAWGLSEVAVAGTVSPGESHAFTVSATAPAAPGVYPFEWQIAESGAWFGHIVRSSIIVNPNEATLVGAAKLDGGQFRFNFASGSSGCQVYASSNLLEWIPLGVPSEQAPGQYQFTDTAATNLPRRFYKLK